MFDVLYLTVLCIIRNVTFLHDIQNTFSALCSKLFRMTKPAVWWEPLCEKPSASLPVCVSKIVTDQCRVTGEILGRTCMSNVWVLTEQIALLFFPLLNSPWLSVLVFLCCVCIGQGVQGPPGLQGVRGKPGPQVSSCCDEQNFAYRPTQRNSGSNNNKQNKAF